MAGKRGRPKGSKTRNPNPNLSEINRANASKPRIAVPTEVRKALSDAKGRLGWAISDYGVDHVVAIIKEGPKNPLFEWAMNFSADRGGLPRRSEADISGDGVRFKITVEGMDAVLGWPPPVVAPAGDDAGDE